MPSMSQSDIETFLQAPRHAIVGTNSVDGPPQLSPVWYLYEAGIFYVSINADSAKYRHLRRDPRLSLCVDGGPEDARTVIAYGVAEILPKEHPQQEPMRLRLIYHYIANPEDARQYAAMSQDWDSVLLVITPSKIISQDFT